MDHAGIRTRRFLLVGFCILLLAAGLYFKRDSILSRIGGFLVVRDHLEPADIIYVLNGDPNTRPFEAARLYRQGLAPKVLISRAENSVTNAAQLTPNSTDLCLRVLRTEGVSEEHLEELKMAGGVTSTFDEANLLARYAQQTGIKKAIIVTSDFHTRRAKWIVEKVLRSDTQLKVMMWPVPNPKYGKDNWWRSEDGLIGCQNEYIKLAFYLTHY